MNNNPVLDWITQCRAAGVDEGQIRSQLLKTGWDNEQVSTLLAGTYQPPVAPTPSMAEGQAAVEAGTRQFQMSAELPGVGTLFSAGWDIIVAQWGKFLGLIGLAAACVAILGGIFYGIGYSVSQLDLFDNFYSSGANMVGYGIAVAALVILYYGFVSIFGSFFQGAFLVTIFTYQQEVPFGTIVKTAFQYLWRLWWVNVLVSFVLGGIFMIFLLIPLVTWTMLVFGYSSSTMDYSYTAINIFQWVLGLLPLIGIVPMALYGVWLCFTPFALFGERLTGFQALLRSREYTRQQWWKIFGRLIVPVLIMVGVTAGLIALQAVDYHFATIIYIAELLFSAAFSAYFVSYLYALYQGARATKNPAELAPKKSTKVGFLVTGFVGWAIIALAFVFMVVAVFGTFDNFGLGSSRARARDATRKSDIAQIRTGLVLYYDDFQTYPNTLQQLAPDYLSTIPTDPSSGSSYFYLASTDDVSDRNKWTNFTVCAYLETGDEYQYCLDGLEDMGGPKMYIDQ